ncbi:hypothetical protein BJ912DRAFT_983770 [Pholiota molesta]|nr:hypothetical protein BJ912DRAFT_983770 [Pholiota molesta]
MGSAFLHRFDVDAWAQQCNTRWANTQGGECQFFNIWRALVNGIPTTYTCAMISNYAPLALRRSMNQRF